DARSAAFSRDDEVAPIDLALLCRIDRRAILEQAIQQQCFDEAQLTLIDAYGVGGIQIERAYLDVLDAGQAQRAERPVVRRLARLRSDRAVVLVLDLQDVRIELAPFAVDDDTDLLVARLDRRDGGRERRDVIADRVCGNREAPLRLVAIPQVAHPQRGRELRMPRSAIELGQELVPVGLERLAQRRRRTEQVA